MRLFPLRNMVLTTVLQLATVTLAGSLATSCATVNAKSGTKKQTVKKKAEKPKNFGLYSNRDLDWKILKRGQKEMGGAALDSY